MMVCRIAKTNYKLYDAYLNIAKLKQPNAPVPDFENKEAFLAESYIDKMPCSTFEIYVYSEVKKAFIAGWKAKVDEYNQGVINKTPLQ